MAKTTIERQLAEVPLFSQYSSKQIAGVARLTTFIDVAAGRELITEGKTGRELFVVIDGEAEVRKAGTVMATRGPGTFFGETALILDRPRNATVVAVTDMTLGVIERRDFSSLLEQHPDLYPPLVTAIAERMEGAEEAP